MKEKLTSRKFWLAAAAFLYSMGASIAGMSCNNDKVVIIGLICSMLSAAIYSAVEAYVDGKSVDSKRVDNDQ